MGKLHFPSIHGPNQNLCIRSIVMPNIKPNGCSAAKSGILSRDLGNCLNQLGCFGDLYFKNSISAFLGDFSELQVLNLVIKFLVKLVVNKRFC